MERYIWCCRLFLNDLDRQLYDKALDDFSCLTAAEREGLTAMLGTFGMLSQPHQGNIRDVLLTAATSVLIDRSMPFVQLMAKGIPNVCKEMFWTLLTLPAINHIFEAQLPTPAKVASVIVSESDDLTNDEANCLHYLKQFVLMLDQEDLDNLLCFVTGSSIMPQHIKVSFTNLTGESRRAIAHTCSNLLELPSTYINWTDFKREFLAILRDSFSYQMTIA